MWTSSEEALPRHSLSKTNRFCILSVGDIERPDDYLHKVETYPGPREHLYA